MGSDGGYFSAEKDIEDEEIDDDMVVVNDNDFEVSATPKKQTTKMENPVDGGQDQDYGDDLAFNAPDDKEDEDEMYDELP